MQEQGKRRRRLSAVAVLGLLSLAAAACSSSGGGSASSSPSAAGSGSSASASSSGSGSAIPAANKNGLTLMFGSSGTAETNAVNAAAKAFTAQSGIKVTVIAANNLSQQVAQGFAGGQPPDLFYIDPSSFQTYAKQGALFPYAQYLPNANDFYPSLKEAFTYKGTFYAAPKDASVLSLYINDADWKAAGLTEADVPKNWSQLASVAKKLTGNGRVGLTMDNSESELDEFLYQNGGTVFDSSCNVALDSPQNVQALTFLKGMLTAGTLAFPATLNAGWSGDAFGKNKAAMSIVGNWLTGAMSSDHPDVKYSAYTIPTGPTGTQATLSFTNGWGIPKSSQNIGGAVEFVKFLTSQAQEEAFTKAFGVIPSLATLKSWYVSAYPSNALILDELAYAHPDIALAGATTALTNFNSQLTQLKSSDPATILKTAQTNLQAVVSQNG